MIPETRILLAEPEDFSPRALARLEEVAEVTLAPEGGWPRDRWPEAFAEFDVVWMRLAQTIGAEQLAERPRCHILACAVTGLDHLDLKACRERGIDVLSLRGETDFLRTVRATAEHTVALLLALLRRIPEARESVRRGEWQRDCFRGRELYGKTAGIVGLGRLGTLVAGYLRAFGMEILAFDPHAAISPEVATRMPSLPALLERSDVVTLHVPLNGETRRLVDAEALAHLKPGAVLVNTSRGGVVEEAALLQALQEGRLAGAALDVLSGEPTITGGHPLVRAAREREDLLIVPHLGGNTWESLHKTEEFLAEKVVTTLQRQLAGEG